MNLMLVVISAVILGSAATALALRNIVRSVLLLVVIWFGLAAFYLWAGAEFAAFAQVLVYGGAVSMVVLFAVLMTRRAPGEGALTPASASRAAAGLLTGGALAGLMVAAVLRSPLPVTGEGRPFVPVRQLGQLLLGPQAAALLVIGAVLTVALLGGVVLAAGHARPPAKGDPP